MENFCCFLLPRTLTESYTSNYFKSKHVKICGKVEVCLIILRIVFTKGMLNESSQLCSRKMKERQMVSCSASHPLLSDHFRSPLISAALQLAVPALHYRDRLLLPQQRVHTPSLPKLSSYPNAKWS